jgi:serpin B
MLSLMGQGLFPCGSDALGAEPGPALVAGNNAFALALYHRLNTADGNLFFSPFSISTCLGMTYAGARGRTASQMALTLHFSTGSEQTAVAFCALLKTVLPSPSPKGVEFDTANGLWGKKERPLLPAFVNSAAQDYGAAVEQADFVNAPEPVRQEINNWVKGKTRGRIEDLLEPGVVSKTTRLVLVNAIYFKGQWKQQFATNETSTALFAVGADRKEPVRLMHLTASFKYLETEGLQLLELPYETGALSMVVLLPRQADGLKALEAELNASSLDRWLAAARAGKVNVFLPRFKLKERLRLAGTLAGMGMPEAFSLGADFSGINGRRDLFISEVVHQAFVDVNEQGTEAAAATATVMKPTAIIRPAPIPTFRADHPFLFLIRHNPSGSIIFLGRLASPAAQASGGAS